MWGHSVKVKISQAGEHFSQNVSLTLKVSQVYWLGCRIASQTLASQSSVTSWEGSGGLRAGAEET